MAEKTEQPTPRHRERVRKDGRVARSQELTTSVTFLAAVLLFYQASDRVIGQVSGLMTRVFTHPTMEVTPTALHQGGLTVAMGVGKVMLPPLLALGVIAAVGAMAQGGFVPNRTPFKPNLGVLNPINGFRRLFSGQGMRKILMGLAKAAVVAYVAYSTLKTQIPLLALAPLGDFRGYVEIIGRTVYDMAFRSAAFFLVVGVLDYVWERRQFEGTIKMTRQDFKEDMKSAEGPQQMRARIRQMQRQWSRQRMLEKVPKADVIVTNPTHLAIALKYDRKAVAAPTVVAKGAGFIAEKIVKKVREHSVPVFQNVPLAHALYKLDLDTAIPPALYQAVAEILAFVYRLRAARAGA